MKYKQKPENKQLKNISALKNPSGCCGNITSAIRKVKPTPTIVIQIKLLVGNCFLVSSIFSLFTKVLFFVKRVLLASTISRGTPSNVHHIIVDPKIDICRVDLVNKATANPKLIPPQNIRFQNLFLVSRLFLFCLQNVAKSSMVTCYNYRFAISNIIIPKLRAILKQIMRCLTAFILCFQAVCVIATPINSADKEAVKRIISKAEIEHEIPRGLLAAIAEVESSNKAYAINVGGRSIYPSSLARAVIDAKEQIESGITNMDLGIMQLNWRWHGKKFASLEEMLTPEKNIAYAASLLKTLYKKHGNWQKAIRHYHSAQLKHNSKYSRKVALIWFGNN